MTQRISIMDRAARRNTWRISMADVSAHRPFEFSMISVHRRLYAQDRAQAEKINTAFDLVRAA